MILTNIPEEKERLKKILKKIPTESSLKQCGEWFEEGDKVYIVKNCKFKRTPLNKLIKSGDIKGLQRVYKPEDATIIVMPRILNTDDYFRSTLTGKKIRGKEGISQNIKWRYYSDEINHEDQYDLWPEYNFVWNMCYGHKKSRFYGNLAKKYPESKYVSFDEYTDSVIKDTFDYELGFMIYSDYISLTADIFNAIGNDKVRLIHEDSMRKLVFEAKQRVDPSSKDFNMEGAIALLEGTNEEMHNVAIHILQNINIEADLYDLLFSFYYKMSKSAQIKLYNHIFMFNPEWEEKLPELNKVGRHLKRDNIDDVYRIAKKIAKFGFTDILATVTRAYDEGILHRLTDEISLSTYKDVVFYGDYDTKAFLRQCKLLGIYKYIDAEKFKTIITCKSLIDYIIKYPEHAKDVKVK